MAGQGEEKGAPGSIDSPLALPSWDHDVDLVEEGDLDVVKEDAQRPPLTGKRRYVPDGLYDQPWSHVHDAYGAATLTPYYIEALTSEDPADVRFGTYGLYSATTHQGSVYKSSQMAVPFLVQLLQLDNEASDRACRFLARIALGEPHFIGAPSQFTKTKYYGTVRKHRKVIKAYLDRTGSDEALRLLSLMPGTLPERLDLSIERALALAQGNTRMAFVKQASALIAQGFLAAASNYAPEGYPPAASAMTCTSLPVSGHIEEVGALMANSPSLLVRGSAAICLAYTGVVNQGILRMLEMVGSEDLHGVTWAWGEFSEMARHAWMFSADADTLIDSDLFLTLDHTTYETDGTPVYHYLPTARLAAAAERIYPAAYTSGARALPLLPEQLDRLQRKLLVRILEAAPKMLGSYHLYSYNLPTNIHSARRTLGESDEQLCSLYDKEPLWFVLEKAVLSDNAQAVKAGWALEKVNVWEVLQEIYRPTRSDYLEESVSLNLKHAYDDKLTSIWEARLASLLADLLGDYQTEIVDFLDEWLANAPQLEGYDWRFQTPGQRIGICLLALVRSNKFSSRYEPLVRPYHPSARYSSFPIQLLQEILPYTSEAHQINIRKTYKI